MYNVSIVLLSCICSKNLTEPSLLSSLLSTFIGSPHLPAIFPSKYDMIFYSLPSASSTEPIDASRAKVRVASTVFLYSISDYRINSSIIVLRSLNNMFCQNRCGYRTDSSRNRGNIRCLLLNLIKIHVPTKVSVFINVYTHIDNNLSL